jgi:hypothetical protein
MMSRRSDFESETKLIQFLAGQLLRGRLAIFLGAGISKPLGLPMWSTLLNRMFKAKHSAPDKSKRLEEQATLFRAKYYANDYVGYVKAIHNSLFLKKSIRVDFDSLHQNKTLSAIGSLVMASHRGSVTSVVSFNFDNLLELYLKYHGYVVRSVVEQDAWAEVADVIVLHPHGYIPFRDLQHASTKLIFDRSSYVGVIGNDKNPWRQQLLCILRTHTCLFIGLSGDCDNLLSLLQDAQTSHASLKHNSAYWGIAFTTAKSDPADIWEPNMVFRKVIANYESELPYILFSICQEAAS